MWKLDKVGNSVLMQYANDMLPGLRDRIVNGKNGIKLDSNDISVLVPHYGTPQEDTSILLDLLTLEPIKLDRLCNHIMTSIISGYDANEFQTYLDNYQKTKLSGNERRIDTKYKDKLPKLEEIFDYKGQISQKPDRSYWLTRVKGTNACTYCNRQYTFTVENYNVGSTVEHIARPDLDHWFCKQMFPILSLSFYNLIPSCHTCNSSAKSNTVFSLSTHVHPYLQTDYNPNFKFRQILTVNGWSVKIDRKEGGREDETIKSLNLEDIYAYHGPLEVKDLIDFERSFSRGYLNMLYHKILNDTYGMKTQEEVYRMLFGTELNPKDFGNRPLSKLKYDILKKLKII